MAVTQRTRFEVLRRDGHSCRYCGATAPDVKLTVDHVTPKALGGTDEPSNLVAACQPCNSGKSSTSLDGETVADIREDALRQAELLKQAYAVLVDQIGKKEDYCDEFIESWEDDLIAKGWRETIGRFHEMGVPIEVLVDASQTAHAREYVQPGVKRFQYFCGIVWNKVSTITAEVAVKQALGGAWMTDADLSEVSHDAFFRGFDAGQKDGVSGAWKLVYERHSGGVVGDLALRAVIDGRTDWSDRYNKFRDRAIEGVVWQEPA